jgi:hypothetical protein
MPRFIAATYHANIKVAEFIGDDGRHLLRCGGTLPWRLNNAGDLMSPVDANNEPAPKKTRNFIGFASVPNQKTGKSSHFFIFLDYESGREQLELSIKRLYAARTLPQLVEKYAPPESNDTAKYTADLLEATGVSGDRTVSELTDTELKKVLDTIEKIEGYHSKAETRKEVWVPVSRITATDGARPLADQEIVLRVDGKDTVLKTNEYGQVPPIAHPDGKAITVLHKQASGDLKSVGIISGDKGQHFSLKTWVQRFFALPGPDEPPADAASRRAASAYTVQPNDTLSKLAAKFETTVEQIKRDNGLKRDAIFAGQQLGIHGPLPPNTKASTPAAKRAALKADPAAKRQVRASGKRRGNAVPIQGGHRETHCTDSGRSAACPVDGDCIPRGHHLRRQG